MQYEGDEGYIGLEKHIADIETRNSKNAPSGRLFYLALPPSVYPQVGPMLHTTIVDVCAQML